MSNFFFLALCSNEVRWKVPTHQPINSSLTSVPHSLVLHCDHSSKWGTAHIFSFLYITSSARSLLWSSFGVLFVWEKESARVCVCVFCECVWDRKCVCVSMWERESVSMWERRIVWVRKKEIVCVLKRVRECVCEYLSVKLTKSC